MDHGLKIRPLDAPFGAEVLDFAPRTPHSPEAGHAWHAALDEHQLLVFRELDLAADAQVKMLGSLGPPLVENDSGRSFQYVSNVHEDGILGDDAFAFHVDHAFMPDPIEVISLYAAELPERGTRTRFLSGIAAAARLSETLRRAVEGRRARHVIDPGGDPAEAALRQRIDAKRMPHAHHPILFDDPRSRQTILFVNEQQTDLIEGMEENQGRILLQQLLEHLSAPEFSYEHAWRPGDLVIWNNLALQHARDAIPSDARRTLRRVSVGGTSVHDHFRHVEKLAGV